MSDGQIVAASQWDAWIEVGDGGMPQVVAAATGSCVSRETSTATHSAILPVADCWFIHSFFCPNSRR